MSEEGTEPTTTMNLAVLVSKLSTQVIEVVRGMSTLSMTHREVREYMMSVPATVLLVGRSKTPSNGLSDVVKCWTDACRLVENGLVCTECIKFRLCF